MARPLTLALVVLFALGGWARPVAANPAATSQNGREGPFAAVLRPAQVVVDDFGNMEVRDSTGQVVPQSTVALDYGFQGRRHDPETGLIYFRARYYDPQAGRFIQRDPVWDPNNMGNPYTFCGNNPVTCMDPTGEFAFIPFIIAAAKIMAVGAAVGGGLEATRQGIQLAEGSRQEFSFGDVGRSAGLGALAAPLLVAAPELLVPLAGLGIASGVTEMSQGNYATGAFDIAASVLPFGSRGVRHSLGAGRPSGFSARHARVMEAGDGISAAASGLWNRRFYRGTTYYEALEAEQSGLNVGQVISRQHGAAAQPHRGAGLYFTDRLHPTDVQGSSSYWAGFHSGTGGRGGGPTVLQGSMSRFRWWGFRRQPGVVSGAQQPGFQGPSTVETFIPEGLAPSFARGMSWRALPWPVEPGGMNLGGLAPLIFGPQGARLWND